MRSPGSRGTHAPFLGTPLLERWQALQCHEVPSSLVGLGCYCRPPCVQRCSLYPSPWPRNLRGLACVLPKLAPWTPGLSPSSTFLPPWADWQDKREQVAYLWLRGLLAQPLPAKVSWTQASEPGLVLSVCPYVCVGGEKGWGWRLSAQGRSAILFLRRVTWRLLSFTLTLLTRIPQDNSPICLADPTPRATVQL